MAASSEELLTEARATCLIPGKSFAHVESDFRSKNELSRHCGHEPFASLPPRPIRKRDSSEDWPFCAPIPVFAIHGLARTRACPPDHPRDPLRVEASRPGLDQISTRGGRSF